MHHVFGLRRSLIKTRSLEPQSHLPPLVVIEPAFLLAVADFSSVHHVHETSFAETTTCHGTRYPNDPIGGCFRLIQSCREGKHVNLYEFLVAVLTCTG